QHHRIVVVRAGHDVLPPNNLRMAFQITLAISEKPEIGLAAWGSGAGAGAAEEGGAASAGASGGEATAALPRRAISAFRLVANWFISAAAVAWIMPTPRPY